MQHLYKNFDEIIYRCSLGQITEPDFDHEFGCELLIYSKHNEHNFLPIYIPEQYRENVYLNQYTMKGDVPFICPNGFVGSVCTSADDIEDAIEEAGEIANSLEGFDLTYDVYSLKRCIEETELLDELDVSDK